VSVADTHKQEASAEITEDDLQPFYAAASAGVKGIMVNHLAATGKVNSDGYPASVSKSAVGELRKFFDGLIMTDDLSMGAVKSAYNPDYFDCLRSGLDCSKSGAENVRYADAINAGNDILLVTSLVNPQEVEGIIEYIGSEVRSGRIDEGLINNATARILKYKCELFSQS